MSGPSSTPSAKAVLGHANRVHGVLVAHGRDDAAARLAAEAEQWAAASTTVVVAGDIKRGKSSLVNALIDRPGLLPVDADVATAVHLVVHHGEDGQAVVTDLGGTRTTIDATDLARYASMHADQHVREAVSTVEVAVDHPLLARGLRLVDTPGVGGMTRGHRDITMAALARADVLVFVVSLQEPVSRTELDFLAEASERIGNVILVGTRADVASDEATRAMTDDLRRRIAEVAAEVARPDDAAAATVAARLDRLAAGPVLATSSYLAEQARRREERGRFESAARLRHQSGLEPLASRLERAADTRDELRLANLLQLCSVLLAAAEDEAATRRRALDGDETVEDELHERQAQLERAASQQARWRTQLGTAMTRLQTQAGRDVTRELGLIRDHYRMLLDDQDDVAGLDLVATQIHQSVQAAWSNLAGHVAERFEAVIAALLADLDIDAETDLFGDLYPPPALAAATTAGGHRPGPGGQIDLVQDALPAAMQTFMFGNITNLVVGALGIASGGLGLVGFGIGAAVAGSIGSARRKQRERNEAAQTLQRELGEALFGQEGVARELTTELSLRILDAREELEELIDERLTGRRRDLEDRRRELQEVLRSERSDRASARREADRIAQELGGLRRETDRLAGEVEAGLMSRFGDHDPTTTPTPNPGALR